MRIVVIGVDGMIGHGLWRYFNENSEHEVMGSMRSRRSITAFTVAEQNRVFISGELEGDNSLHVLMENLEPDFLINCAGVTKHIAAGNDPLQAIASNSLLPHRIARVAALYGARMLHISTDCVYSGKRGNYSENEAADADDTYGRSKALGEIAHNPSVLTIRTSTIGYEINSSRGLLEWFLAQSNSCRGFTNAFFSGLTTHELGRVINDYIVNRPEIFGLYHVAGPRISKYELLLRMADRFNKKIDIFADDELAIDRSLDGSLFSTLVGYRSPSWDSMLVELAGRGR